MEPQNGIRETEAPIKRAPRALVTNDDGLHSEGLWVLADAAREAGLAPLIVAPSWDSSGASASLTAVSERGRVLVDRHRLKGAHRVRALGVHGAPAFIVRAAVYGAFGPPPEIVLSGINRGSNIGHAVLHSGTVGAALTGANYGRRALAISVDVKADPADGNGHQNWQAAGHVARKAIQWLMDTPDGTALNVNVPALPVGHLRGVKLARLAPAGVVQANVTEVQEGFVPVTFSDDGDRSAPDSDVRAVADGYVAVTPIRPVCEDTRVDLESLLDGGSQPLGRANGVR